MAKAIVKKSKGGRDLVVLTMGPKETAKVLAVLASWEDDGDVMNIFNALDDAQDVTNNAVNAEIKTELVIS